MPPLFFLVLVTGVAAVCWLVGEVRNMPLLRRISGPVFSALLAVSVVIVTTVHVSFSDSIKYSGATREFVVALVAAIDRGDAASAHAELRTFEEKPIETYEGGLPDLAAGADGASEQSGNFAS